MALRQTADFRAIKTGQIVFQYPDGSFPPTGAVLEAVTDRGQTDWTGAPTLDSVTLAGVTGSGTLTWTDASGLLVNGAAITCSGGGGGSGPTGPIGPTGPNGGGSGPIRLFSLTVDLFDGSVFQILQWPQEYYGPVWPDSSGNIDASWNCSVVGTHYNYLNIGTHTLQEIAVHCFFSDGVWKLLRKCEFSDGLPEATVYIHIMAVPAADVSDFRFI